VASLTKDMQTEQLLGWSDMTDTKFTTSGSNEEYYRNDRLMGCTSLSLAEQFRF